MKLPLQLCLVLIGLSASGITFDELITKLPHDDQPESRLIELDSTLKDSKGNESKYHHRVTLTDQLLRLDKEAVGGTLFDPKFRGDPYSRCITVYGRSVLTNLMVGRKTVDNSHITSEVEIAKPGVCEDWAVLALSRNRFIDFILGLKDVRIEDVMLSERKVLRITGIQAASPRDVHQAVYLQSIAPYTPLLAESRIRDKVICTWAFEPAPHNTRWSFRGIVTRDVFRRTRSYYNIRESPSVPSSGVHEVGIAQGTLVHDYRLGSPVRYHMESRLLTQDELKSLASRQSRPNAQPRSRGGLLASTWSRLVFAAANAAFFLVLGYAIARKRKIIR